MANCQFEIWVRNKCRGINVVGVIVIVAAAEAEAEAIPSSRKQGSADKDKQMRNNINKIVKHFAIHFVVIGDARKCKLASSKDAASFCCANGREMRLVAPRVGLNRAEPNRNAPDSSQKLTFERASREQNRIRTRIRMRAGEGSPRSVHSRYFFGRKCQNMSNFLPLRFTTQLNSDHFVKFISQRRKATRNSA